MCAILFSLFGVAFPLIVLAETTNEVALVTFETTRGPKMHCVASEARLRADKKWDIAKSEIPLGPKKAHDIADAWVRKRMRSRELSLVRMEILPLFVRSRDLEGHYCYIVEFVVFATMRAERISVAVLMDGTLIEPKLVVD